MKLERKSRPRLFGRYADRSGGRIRYCRYMQNSYTPVIKGEWLRAAFISRMLCGGRSVQTY